MFTRVGLCWLQPCDTVATYSATERAEREQWHLLHSVPYFSHSLCYPQSNWALLVLIPEWMGSCMFWDPVGLSNKLSCEAGSFSHCCNTHRFFQSKALRLYFSKLEPWVVQSVSLLSCSFWFITHKCETTRSTSDHLALSANHHLTFSSPSASPLL